MKPFPRRTLAFLLSACALTATASGSDWPQWRGPARDGVAALGSSGPTSLNPEPKVLWRKKVGGGYSSPIIARGTLVYLDEDGVNETAHALDAATGKELWLLSFATMFRDEWGAGPRSTPLIDGDRVYVQSCNGEFRCLGLADGHAIWKTSFEKDFGVVFLGSKANEGTAARRGNNGSGVIDGERIILPVGSTNGASLVCFDKKIGNVIWKSQDDEAAYSSLMVATLAGIKQVIAFTAEALMGADLQDGRLLWRVPLKTNAKRHTATPVILGDTVLVNSHTFGLICLRIEKDGDGQKATEAWVNKDLKINLATPVVVGKYLYSHGPAQNFVCVDSRTGKEMWRHDGFGKDYSSTIVLGKNLLVLTDMGELVLVAADSSHYKEVARRQVCGKTWSFPAYTDGKLYVRDGRELVCLDLIHPD
jgi:outer membrane protein assembly factor BamB